jgi:signal transduction histidine kinase
VGTVHLVHEREATGGWARWASRRDVAFDLGLMVLVQLLVVVLTMPLLRHGWWGLGIQFAVNVFLVFRRVAPQSVLALILLSTIGLTVLGTTDPAVLASMIGDMRSQGWVVLSTPFVTYAAAVYGSDRRRTWLMIGITTVVACRPWEPSALARTVGVMVVLLLPALLGNYVRGLTDRVERAERQQHRLAEQARVEERVRLAAEMHDVVTHRISLMVLQAGALGVTAGDPETRAAAEDLRAAGCQALEELRDLVGVLRASPGEAAEDVLMPRAGGQAEVPDFAELCAESESVGVPVRLEQSGDAQLASPVVARTVYRIVQESLTNVRKHAPGADATVRVRYTSDQVRLVVRNGAPERGGDAGLTASGSGTGLLGLRQRVELVSGSLAAGPTEDGGFEVDATLPAYVPTPDTGGPRPAERTGATARGTRAVAGFAARAHRARGGG